MSIESIALNRLGLGARPNEQLPKDPKRWILSQLETYEVVPDPWKQAQQTPALVKDWLDQQQSVRQAPEGKGNAAESVKRIFVRAATPTWLQ